MQQDSHLHEIPAVTPGRPDPSSGEANWRAALRDAVRTHSISQWRIGDLLNEGDAAGYRSYVEAKAEVREAGFTDGTLWNLRSLARAFPPSRRREDLSWSHHAEVQGQSPEKQDRLLANAADGRWSVARLRMEKLKLALPPPSTAAVPIPRPVVLETVRRELTPAIIAETRAATFAPAEPQQPFDAGVAPGTAACRGELSKVLEAYGAAISPTLAHAIRAALAVADRELMRRPASASKH